MSTFISVRLLNMLSSGQFAFSNFSAKHNIHRLVSGVYGFFFAYNSPGNIVMRTPSFSLILHASVDRAVLCWYLSRLKDDLCPEYHFLKVPSQKPIYFFGWQFCKFKEMVAPLTILLVRQLLSRGQIVFLVQLQKIVHLLPTLFHTRSVFKIIRLISLPPILGHRPR